MHNILFVLIWPIAISCALLHKRRLGTGILIFIACQLGLWFSTISAMNSSTWDDSPGDAFVPALISLPLLIYVGLLALRGIFVLVSCGLEWLDKAAT